MLLALLIFIATIVLVIWQPKGLGVGWSATLGAILALACGVISLADIPVVWHIIWNATGTFVALIIIKAIFGIRVSEQAEREGLDIATHGERAYN